MVPVPVGNDEGVDDGGSGSATVAVGSTGGTGGIGGFFLGQGGVGSTHLHGWSLCKSKLAFGVA